MSYYSFWISPLYIWCNRWEAVLDIVYPTHFPFLTSYVQKIQDITEHTNRVPPTDVSTSSFVHAAVFHFCRLVTVFVWVLEVMDDPTTFVCCKCCRAPDTKEKVPWSAIAAIQRASLRGRRVVETEGQLPLLLGQVAPSNRITGCLVQTN